MNRAEMYR